MAAEKAVGIAGQAAGALAAVMAAEKYQVYGSGSARGLAAVMAAEKVTTCRKPDPDPLAAVMAAEKCSIPSIKDQQKLAAVMAAEKFVQPPRLDFPRLAAVMAAEKCDLKGLRILHPLAAVEQLKEEARTSGYTAVVDPAWSRSRTAILNLATSQALRVLSRASEARCCEHLCPDSGRGDGCAVRLLVDEQTGAGVGEDSGRHQGHPARAGGALRGAAGKGDAVRPVTLAREKLKWQWPLGGCRH
jgi:hypothetical protein